MEGTAAQASREQKIARKPLLSKALSSPIMEVRNSDEPRFGEEGDSIPSEKTTGSAKILEVVDDERHFDPWIDNRSIIRRWVTDWWLLELFSCLITMAASFTIMGVLLKYNNRALPNWPSYITLNSLLALFTTIAKAGLMLPIAEALGQLKWLWFAEAQRPLTQFQTFDEASRGITGSFKLLKVLKGRHLACLGAVISIMGLATSFITQQMIAYPTRIISTYSNASTAATSNLYYAFTSHRTSATTIDLPMQGAINRGLYNAIDEAVPIVSPICSTGNCTWDPFTSLEVCSKVANVSSKLTGKAVRTEWMSGVDSIGKPYNVSVDFTTNVSLPNGAYLMATGATTLNLTTPDLPFSKRSLAFLDMPNMQDVAIANVFLIYRSINDGGYESVTASLHSAIEILFYWCVNTHTAQVVNGVATTNTTESSTYVRDANVTSINSTAFDHDPSSPRDFTAMNMSSSAHSKDNFTVESQSNTLLGEFLTDILKGEAYTGSPWETTTITSEILAMNLWEVFPGAENATEQQTKDLQLQLMSNFTSNIATSMTNNIRARPFRGEPASGNSQTSESYVKVRWAWFSYLLILFVLSIIFLVATMIKSSMSDVNILKSSSLAVMCGMNEESKGNMKQIEMRGKIWQRAERMKVRLEKNDGGWRLERKK